MMRYIVLILIGLGLAETGITQTLQAVPGGRQDAFQAGAGEASELDIGLGQVKQPGEKVDIFSNRTDTASAEMAITTNLVKESQIGFLISTGVEYASEGEYEEAEKAYLRALEADPQNNEIRFRLAGLYVRMERVKEAADLYKALAEQNPENPQVLNNLAWCYATGPDIRNTKLALHYVREALLYDPISPSIWNTLAEAYYVTGEYDKALRAAEYALELLQAIRPDEETQKSFMAQIGKILRAQAARNVLEGLDEEE